MHGQKRHRPRAEMPMMQRYYKADKDRNRMEQLEKENLKQRLNYLRYQISPHFFMNTLNNIHALVDIDPEKAKKSIVELSKLMRHILYDGDTNISPLSDEVQFLQNYIALMKMRFTGMVKVNTDFPAMTSQIGNICRKCFQTWSEL